MKCPVCKTALPLTGVECPTCGLPRELWPTSPEAGAPPPGANDDVFGDLMKDLEGLEGPEAEEPVAAPAPAAPPPRPARAPPAPSALPTPTPTASTPAPAPAPAPTPTPAPAPASAPEPVAAPPTVAPTATVPASGALREAPSVVAPLPPAEEAPATPAPEPASADATATGSAAAPPARASESSVSPPAEALPAASPAPAPLAQAPPEVAPSVPVPPPSASPAPVPTVPSVPPPEAPVAAPAERPHPGHVEAVVVAPQPEDDGLPLQEIMDEVSAMIQVGRRAAFDMTSFGPTAARAVGLVRAGASDEARRMLTSLRKRLYDYLAPKFSARVEQLEIKIQRIRTFLRTDQAQLHLERTREALRTGDFARAQVELRRLEGETTRLEEELGPLGKTLEQVDMLTAEVERMGGDTTPALLYQGKALDAARMGDRRKAEGLLTTASAMLLDTLAPLIGRELIQLTETIKKLRGQGRDIRAAVGLIRQITVDLKTRNYARAVASLARLREEISRQGEIVARAQKESALPPELAPETDAMGPRVRIRGRGTAVAVSSADTSSSAPSRSSYEAPVGQEPAPAPAPAPSPPPVAARSEPPPLEVRPGRTYLILEQRARRGAQVFLKLKAHKSGLFLTTTFPPRITEETPLPGSEVVWLSASPGWEDSLDPRMLEHDVAARVHAFLRDENSGAIAIDGLGYLISENGVDKVEKFLKGVLDTAAAKGIGVVVTLAPGGIEPKAQARLGALFDFTS